MVDLIWKWRMGKIESVAFALDDARFSSFSWVCSGNCNRCVRDYACRVVPVWRERFVAQVGVIFHVFEGVELKLRVGLVCSKPSNRLSE